MLLLLSSLLRMTVGAFLSPLSFFQLDVTSLSPTSLGPQQWAAALALQHRGAPTRNHTYSREFHLKCSAEAMNGHLSSESSFLRSFKELSWRIFKAYFLILSFVICRVIHPRAANMDHMAADLHLSRATHFALYFPICGTCRA